MRTVRVDPGRVPGWVDRFTARHGPVESLWDSSTQRLVITAADGAVAGLRNDWNSLPAADLADLLDHLQRLRHLGIVLARKSAHAVGIADVAAGTGRVVTSRVDTHYVQARTKAGGWSQQRYARRRANQAGKAWDDAADDVAELLVGQPLDALVCGGDRVSIDHVLGDPRLVSLLPLRAGPLLNVSDPRRAVLDDVVADLGRVPIELNALA